MVFSGAPITRFLDDSDYAFVTNPHFASWLPLTTAAHCYVIYTPGKRPTLVYFQPEDYWHAPPEDPSGFWTDSYDIQIVRELSDIEQHLPAAREKCILIGELRDAAHAFGIERVNPDSAMNILHYGRGRKTAYELECMRMSSQRAVSGHRAAEAAFLDGGSEYDIHIAYCAAADHSESELPYTNIIGLNEHAAILHYQHLDRAVPDNIRSFLIDAGADVYRYATDITRTYSSKDDEFAELIDAFEELQLGLVSEVKAGVDYKDLHLLTHERIAEFLVQHDFASGNSDALVNEGVTAAFFPHGLGHLLGIQVHDVGGFMADVDGNAIDKPSGHPYLRLTRKLEEDMVLTIEPGIYVIDLLLDNLEGTPAAGMINRSRIDWLRPYGGIRIEDNVRVTADSNENLTRQAFDAA